MQGGKKGDQNRIYRQFSEAGQVEGVNRWRQGCGKRYHQEGEGHFIGAMGVICRVDQWDKALFQNHQG
jgi:hypothetical protein